MKLLGTIAVAALTLAMAAPAHAQTQTQPSTPTTANFGGNSAVGGNTPGAGNAGGGAEAPPSSTPAKQSSGGGFPLWVFGVLPLIAIAAWLGWLASRRRTRAYPGSAGGSEPRATR